MAKRLIFNSRSKWMSEGFWTLLTPLKENSKSIIHEIKNYLLTIFLTCGAFFLVHGIATLRPNKCVWMQLSKTQLRTMRVEPKTIIGHTGSKCRWFGLSRMQCSRDGELPIDYCLDLWSIFPCPWRCYTLTK